MGTAITMPSGRIVEAVSQSLLHMRARPNLMTQTLDDMGGLVASRLHDRMQACAGMQACACDGLSGDPGGMVLMSF